MVFEFESLPALSALELSEIRAVLVIVHMSLKFGEIRELLGAHCARLKDRSR